MHSQFFILVLTLAVFGCVSSDSVLDDYEQLTPAAAMSAPAATAAVSAAEAAAVARGKYLVELLACGVCHTDGALVGNPASGRSLGGSSVGIAYTNPLQVRYPGIVFPPNITPDKATGIGGWTDREIEAAILAGFGRHGKKRIAVMPWQSYATLSGTDVRAIVGYLRHIEPVRHRVPQNVAAGQRSAANFVHFGIYRSRR